MNNEILDIKNKLLKIENELSNNINNKIKIAIIEPGGVAEVGNIKLAGSWNFKNNSNDISNNISYHATSVASTLLFCNSNVDIYSLVAKDIDITTDTKFIRNSMSECIEWCISNNIDIINMSLGFSNYDPVVDSYLKKAYDNDIIVVAAVGNNSNFVSFPASSPYVISVGNWDESKNSLNETSSYGIGTDFVTNGTNIKAYNEKGILSNVTGSSYACPNLCGIIADILSKNKNLKFEQIYDILKQNETYDNKIGWGVVNGYQKLPDTIPNRQELINKEINNNVTTEFNTYEIKTYDSLNINLKYTDGYKKTILNQIDGTIVGTSNINNGTLVGLLTGETYIYITDKFGNKNFSKVIVSNTVTTGGKNVIIDRVTTERGFNFDKQNISKVLDSGITGKNIKIGILGGSISSGIADFNIKSIVNIDSSNLINDQKNINMVSTICSRAFGYSPDCSLYYLKAGESSISWASGKKAIQWFINNKMDIVIYYGPSSSDNNTLISALNKAGIIVVAPYVAPSANSTNPHINNSGVIHVGYVSEDQKIVTDMAFRAKPPVSDKIDCVGYGYGIKSYNIKTLDPCITTLSDNGGMHFYLCLQACCQVISILALMKQQYPKMNTAEKARKLLPYLCKPISGYAKNQVGNGLIQAKLASELNLPDNFFN